MSDLKALVYVSSAAYELSDEKIKHILGRARDRNIEHHVTGVLLFIGGNFMQYIEGPADELDLIYSIIKADPDHKGLIELMHHAIEARDFSSWSMAYCTKNRAVLVGDQNDQQILGGKLGGGAYMETPARILLRNFWSKNSP